MKVSPDDGSGVLSQALAFTRHLDLSSEQNNIMINFSNSNYVELEGKMNTSINWKVLMKIGC